MKLIKIFPLLIILTIFLNSCSSLPKIYEQKILNQSDIDVWFDVLPSLDGVPYVWGGENLNGIDCSGLVIYLYNKAGYQWLYNGSELTKDVNSSDLYYNNSNKISFDELKKGDLIFLDTDGDGYLNHVSIFERIDNNNIWVWDAVYIIDGIKINKVSHRILKLKDIYKIYYGRMLKIVYY